ncbi:MAG: asparagine synthetase B family protein [Candidatus Latescibacterota bacterium]
MPGLSILYNFHGYDEKRETAFLQALDSALHTGRYKREILTKERNFLLGCTKYEEYPVTAYQGESFSCFVEGCIYRETSGEIERELIGLAESLFFDHQNGKEKLRRWLIDTDGEFIVLLRKNDTGEIILFNDLLGHLPLYYHSCGDFLLVSREIGVFQNFLSDIQLDRMALAQYLLFAFPLGERTLLDKVRRIKQASLLSIKTGDSTFSLETLHELNYEIEEHAGRPLGANIDHLISLLETACRVRAHPGGVDKNIVSLSGGLDSRAVAGGLRRNRIPFRALTYMDYRKIAQKDLDLAREVASILQVPWTRLDLDPPRGKDTFRLLDMKHGLNYLSMRFIIPYFDEIVNRFGPDISYFTGNTGMSLRSYTPDRHVSNSDETVKFLFSRGGKFLFVPLFSIEESAALTGIDRKHLFGEIENEIASYPERSYDRKYLHFMFSGYCFNWHYEGMDMQRGFLWQMTPLESTPFFLYAIGCPNEQKAHYRLYRELITQLTPEAAVVNNATWDSPINSPKTVLNFFVRSWYNRLPSSVKGTVRKLFRTIPRYEAQSPLVRCFREQSASCPAISEYFSPDMLEAALKKAGKLEFDTLFTLTSLIEEISTGQSMLRKYMDAVFE